MEPGLSPDALYNFSERMMQDEDLFWNFSWGQSRNVGEKYYGTEKEWRSWSL